MKILHIIPLISKGGAEKIAISLANHATSKGHFVAFLSYCPAEPSEYPASFSQKVQQRFIVKNEKKLQFRYFKLLIWLYQARDWVFSFDIIHCHLIFGSVAGTMIQILRAFQNKKKPAVIETCHAVGMPISKFKRSFLGILSAKRDGLALMAMDFWWYRYLEKNPDLCCSVIHNGIKTFPRPSPNNILAYRKNAGIPRSARWVVGTVGRLAPERRPLAYIPIFAEVHKLLGERVHFLLVGAGPHLEKLKETVQRHQLNRQVHLPGIALDPRLPMSVMDLYITLNIGSVTGVAALEAVALNVPVLARQELLDYQTQSTDWIWSSQSPQLLAKEIVKLLKNRKFRKDVARKQKTFFTNHHTIDVMASGYYDLYRRAISSMKF